MAMIDVAELTKNFGRATAVESLSFAVPAGEIFGLLGPNGAGKTTTVRMLTGLLRPTSGTAKVADFDVLRQRRQMLSSIGVAFELPALYPRLTVEENLRFAASLRGASHTALGAAVDRLGLQEHRRRQVRFLSKGWRQRAMIARAVIAQPKVLFLDEPTSGLDPNAAADLHDVLRSLRTEGATILLTTHDMVEAAELCDRVGILSQGRLVALDSPAALVERLQDRSVRLTWWEEGALREAAVPLAGPATPDLLRQVLSRHRVLQIETTGSLDEVYRRLTGGREE
jgi:ABC-2 type transport system ATP-binding protein